MVRGGHTDRSGEQGAREEDLSIAILCGEWISVSKMGGDPRGSPMEAGGSQTKAMWQLKRQKNRVKLHCGDSL